VDINKKDISSITEYKISYFTVFIDAMRDKNRQQSEERKSLGNNVLEMISEVMTTVNIKTVVLAI
jgi:hypothetical protein